MIVRQIALTAAPAYQRLIPPDAQAAHTGRWQWTIIFPAAITLAEDSAGTNAVVGAVLGANPVAFTCENETLWGAGTGNVLVIGCHAP